MRQPDGVTAPIVFVRHPREKAYLYVFDPPAGIPMDNCESDERLVRIANARTFERPPVIGREGFQLLKNPTAVCNFDDTEELQRVYYEECRAMVRAATGCREVVIFDHLVRKRSPDAVSSALGRGTGQSAHAGPATRAHNDYSAASGERRLNMVLSRPEQTPPDARFAIVNIWRSARGPIIDSPLALCDGRSVTPGELVDTEIRYPRRTGAIYQVAHGKDQRWAYFHELQPDEAILFKQYDSDPSQPRFTPHAAFRHPHTPPETPPRESVEVRCLVLF